MVNKRRLRKAAEREAGESRGRREYIDRDTWPKSCAGRAAVLVVMEPLACKLAAPHSGSGECNTVPS